MVLGVPIPVFVRVRVADAAVVRQLAPGFTPGLCRGFEITPKSL